MTYREAYEPIMAATTKEEAEAQFERCVACHLQQEPSHSRDVAVEVQKRNVGYYAGYYDAETRNRVYAWLNTEHPIFGDMTPSADEAIAAGVQLAEGRR